jgi:hypothetical protein
MNCRFLCARCKLNLFYKRAALDRLVGCCCCEPRTELWQMSKPVDDDRGDGMGFGIG